MQRAGVLHACNLTLSGSDHNASMRSGDPGDPVEFLQEVVRGNLDLLVSPFRSSVDAGDQAGPMHPAEVAVHERVSRLRLVVRALGQAEVPGGVLVPRVTFEKGVTRVRVGLHLAPVAVQDVLLRLDQLARLCDSALVDLVPRHGSQSAAGNQAPVRLRWEKTAVDRPPTSDDGRPAWADRAPGARCAARAPTPPPGCVR